MVQLELLVVGSKFGFRPSDVPANSRTSAKLELMWENREADQNQ